MVLALGASLLRIGNSVSLAVGNAGYAFLIHAEALGAEAGAADLQRAGRCFGTALAIDGHNGSALRGMGMVRYGQEDLEAARVVTQKSTRCDPDHAMGHYRLGEVLHGLGALDEALAAWTRAGAAPRLLDFGDEQTERRAFGFAQEIYGAVLGLDLPARKRGDVHCRLGRVFASDGNPEKARESFELAVQSDATVYGHHARLGEANMMLGDWEAAERAFVGALALRPTHGWGLYNMGDVALRQEKIGQAMSFLAEAIERDSANAFAHARLGLCLLRQGDPARAKEEFLAAISIDASRPGFHLDLARVYERLRQPDLARQQRVIAASLTPARP